MTVEGQIFFSVSKLSNSEKSKNNDDDNNKKYIYTQKLYMSNMREKSKMTQKNVTCAQSLPLTLQISKSKLLMKSIMPFSFNKLHTPRNALKSA